MSYPFGFKPAPTFGVECPFVDPFSLMRRKLFLRWLWIVLAIPFGAVTGFYAVAFVCATILRFWSTGSSSNDTMTSISLGILGVILGGTLLPWGISQLTLPPKE